MLLMTLALLHASGGASRICACRHSLHLARPWLAPAALFTCSLPVLAAQNYPLAYCSRVTMGSSPPCPPMRSRTGPASEPAGGALVRAHRPSPRAPNPPALRRRRTAVRLLRAAGRRCAPTGPAGAALSPLLRGSAPGGKGVACSVCLANPGAPCQETSRPGMNASLLPAPPLCPAGALVRGLGPQLLSDLAGLPLVRSAFPRLHGEMQAALQHLAATQLHTGGRGGGARRLALQLAACLHALRTLWGVLAGDWQPGNRVVAASNHPLPPVDPVATRACRESIPARVPRGRRRHPEQPAGPVSVNQRRPAHAQPGGERWRGRRVPFSGPQQTGACSGERWSLPVAASPERPSEATGHQTRLKPTSPVRSCFPFGWPAGGAAAHQQPGELPRRVVPSDEGGGGPGGLHCKAQQGSRALKPSTDGRVLCSDVASGRTAWPAAPCKQLPLFPSM